MKFFNWMHNKLNGGQRSRICNAVPTTNQTKEEFNDWPDSLLAIGTFGNKSCDLKERAEQSQLHVEDDHHEDEILENSPDLAEFTPEEVGKLQKELTKLLSRKPAASNADDILPLDRFLNCPSSLEVDRRISSSRLSSTNSDNFDYDEEEIDRTIRVIIGRCKDVCNKQNKIGKKSISFLLKKMFVCASGNFGPAPSLPDPFQESRMEKLLRTMLSKKINPQNASRTTTKRYLEDKHTHKEEQEEKKPEKTCNDGSKWVKTDSDFIVLEI